MKKLLILGATGSVGLNTIDVVKAHPTEFSIEALVANTNAVELAQLAKETGTKTAAIFDQSKYQELKNLLANTNVKVIAGENAILELCQEEYDITVSAITGIAGLKPTYHALKNSKAIALANKESLIVAGELIFKAAAKYNTKILPLDSEHNAIFQVFEDENATNVKKVTLTASGGPFRYKTLEEMSKVTPKEAIAHPNWKMGAKISVDSATLMNKGLEYIETCLLFPVKPEQVDVVIHPQSIIHSLVTYEDGSTLAQLSMPDMRVPIAYALAYPKRIKLKHKELDLAQLAKLEFMAPDYKRFPLLKSANDAFVAGHSARVVLNAANEVAVDAFLNDKIGFLDIAKTVQAALNSSKNVKLNSLDNVLGYNELVCNQVKERLAA
jgi:1-deoxy-D-xylulose-5-phosphate reductoisomerase